MWIWSFAVELFEGDKYLAGVALALVVLTVQLAAVGVCTKSAGLYAALCLALTGGGSVFLLARGVAWKGFFLMLAIVCGLMGSGYAIVYLSVEIRERIAERKARREEKKRRVQFTLPDRENQYLRDRLQTALHTEREEAVLEKRVSVARMGYARKLLAQVKESPLTPVERIDVEEFAKLLAAYDRKGKWSASDVKTVSEIFSRLLKLAAKYEIAV
jgi:hypothetical protein